MTNFGKGFVEAARQAQSIARGEADPATYQVHVPADITSFGSAASDGYAAKRAAAEAIADRS